MNCSSIWSFSTSAAIKFVPAVYFFKHDIVWIPAWATRSFLFIHFPSFHIMFHVHGLTSGPWAWGSASSHRWCSPACLDSSLPLSLWCCIQMTAHRGTSETINIKHLNATDAIAFTCVCVPCTQHRCSHTAPRKAWVSVRARPCRCRRTRWLTRRQRGEALAARDL